MSDPEEDAVECPAKDERGNPCLKFGHAESVPHLFMNGVKTIEPLEKFKVLDGGAAPAPVSSNALGGVLVRPVKPDACNVEECPEAAVSGDVLCARHLAARKAWEESAKQLAEGSPPPEATSDGSPSARTDAGVEPSPPPAGPRLLGVNGQPIKIPHAAGGSPPGAPLPGDPPAAPFPRGVSRAPSRPAPVEPAPFERDSPKLVSARAHFWRMLALVRAELAEATSAIEACKKEQRPLREFQQALRRIEKDLMALHATAYSNTLMERYDAVQPLILDAYQVARQAGIKIPGAPGPA